MEVILREDVDKLGRRGDVAKVAEGYGRNFLLPRGLAMQVSEANQAMIAKERKAHELRLAKEKSIAPRKVGEHDVLYGSVTAGDIADFLKAKGVEIDKRKVHLDEPIKKLGEHEVSVKLHPEVSANLRVLVTKEG